MKITVSETTCSALAIMTSMAMDLLIQVHLFVEERSEIDGIISISIYGIFYTVSKSLIDRLKIITNILER